MLRKVVQISEMLFMPQRFMAAPPPRKPDMAEGMNWSKVSKAAPTEQRTEIQTYCHHQKFSSPISRREPGGPGDIL